jgi:arylsulfatase A-like enzyme
MIRIASYAMVVIAGIAPLATAGDQPSPRPNILVCIADDWSWPHASAYGDRVVRTPTFDRVAAQGALFARAFCAAPSCTASRGALLTGQAVPRLGEGANLWSRLPKDLPCYTDLLEAAGYKVGSTGKGWAPGRWDDRGHDPAGTSFRSFEAFLDGLPSEKPFCFWYGSTDPHRPYEAGSGHRAGLRAEKVAVPLFLPDTPEVRDDLLDYYAEVQRFDLSVESVLAVLERSGRAENTLVVVTSDNGLPFPRAKANLYDAGTRVPLAVRWPARVRPGRTIQAFVGLEDLAPTFLEAAGQSIPVAMTGRSLIGLLDGRPAPDRERIFLARERHANVRKGDVGYPCRAVRTERWLYIRNFHPERWPAGDPEAWKSVGPFGDVDDSPTKQLLLARRAEPPLARFFELAFARRPAEELYDVEKDAGQLVNLAGQGEYAKALQTLQADLDRRMRELGDPRAEAGDDRFDRFPYYGPLLEPAPMGSRKTNGR